MTPPPRPDWNPAQRERLAEWDVERAVDVHCHLLPGLDDGPVDLPEAVALAEALAADGVTTVAATPHQLGRYDRLNSAEVVREGIAEVAAACAAAGIPLEIVPGGDVRIDERLPKLLEAGEITSLAEAGRHLLLELPHELLVDPVPTIRLLRERGWQTILTHPERYRYLAGREALVASWVAEGAVVQITAGSLVGDFGRQAWDAAWRLIQLGLVAIVATDAHDPRRRPPRMTAALELLAQEAGAETARRLCLAHPLRVLRGQSIELEIPGAPDA